MSNKLGKQNAARKHAYTVHRYEDMPRRYELMFEGSPANIRDISSEILYQLLSEFPYMRGFRYYISDEMQGENYYGMLKVGTHAKILFTMALGFDDRSANMDAGIFTFDTLECDDLVPPDTLGVLHSISRALGFRFDKLFMGKISGRLSDVPPDLFEEGRVMEVVLEI